MISVSIRRFIVQYIWIVSQWVHKAMVCVHKTISWCQSNVYTNHWQCRPLLSTVIKKKQVPVWWDTFLIKNKWFCFAANTSTDAIFLKIVKSFVFFLHIFIFRVSLILKWHRTLKRTERLFEHNIGDTIIIKQKLKSYYSVVFFF